MSSHERLVNQNWWFTTLMVNAHSYCPPLTKDIKCDVLIVGGGFSGVSAAAEFLKKGLSVIAVALYAWAALATLEWLRARGPSARLHAAGIC